MTQVAIQGMAGSFHDIAAHQYFRGEPITLICCATFEQVFRHIGRHPQAVGLVAIENTIAGSLLHNYELLRDSGAVVVGEHRLHISHCICCLPTDSWDTIGEVHSHPVALQQCRRFLAARPHLRAIEADDTAGAAIAISQNKSHGWAAICSEEAARQNAMRILENHIEDNKHNFTRFLVVCHPDRREHLLSLCPTANKASLVFSLPHEEGSLSQVLSILSFYRINLTKIQSLPIIGREWEYLFYIDVLYAAEERFHQSIDAIRPLVSELKILGEYRES